MKVLLLLTVLCFTVEAKQSDHSQTIVEGFKSLSESVNKLQVSSIDSMKKQKLQLVQMSKSLVSSVRTQWTGLFSAAEAPKETLDAQTEVAAPEVPQMKLIEVSNELPTAVSDYEVFLEDVEEQHLLLEDSRSQNLQNLLNHVDNVFREQNSYELKEEDRNKGFKIYMKRDAPADEPLVLTKFTFPDVSPDRIKSMFENWQTVQKQMQDSIISLDKIGEEDGNDVILQKVSCPWPVNNRYFVNLFYKLYDFNGEQDHHVLLVSSEGTDSYNRGLNLDETHAFTNLNAYMVWPVKDERTGKVGSHVNIIQNNNFGGNIPRRLRKKFGAAQGSYVAEGFYNYLH